jgi:hypothetical protein
MSLAPVAALIYPLTLSLFHTSVTAFQSGARPIAAVITATISLALSFILPALILMSVLHLSGIEKPTALQLRRMAGARLLLTDMIGGSLTGSLVATLIILAISGMRVHFT